MEITCSLRNTLTTKFYVNITSWFSSFIFLLLVIWWHSAKRRTPLLKRKMHVLEVLHLGKLFKVSFTWYKGRDFFSGYSSNGEKMLFCFSAELRCICVSLRYSFTLVHILCLVSGHKHRGAEVSLYTGFLGRFLKTLPWFGSQWPQKIHRQKNEGGSAGRLTLRPWMMPFCHRWTEAKVQPGAFCKRHEGTGMGRGSRSKDYLLK